MRCGSRPELWPAVLLSNEAFYLLGAYVSLATRSAWNYPRGKRGDKEGARGPLLIHHPGNSEQEIFLHSSSSRLLIAYCVPGTLLHARNTVVNKTDESY